MPLKKKILTHEDRSEGSGSCTSSSVSDEGQFASTNQNM